MNRLFSIFILLIISINNAESYETPTHARLSRLSIRNSTLITNADILSNMGVDNNINNPAFPSEVPIDELEPDPNETINKDEASIFKIVWGGSVLEDRVEFRNLTNYWPVAVTGVAHHFFDPQNNGRALINDEGDPVGLPSPQWVLEPNGNNDYSYPNAIKYFYGALVESGVEVRKENFGKMFRSLGHTIHHIQDMAQPQHVRNDNHCSVHGVCWWKDLAFDPSHYETYTNDHKDRLIDEKIDTVVPVIFSKARDYWENAQESGIAQFTSLNFVSEGSNFELDPTGNIIQNAEFEQPAPFKSNFEKLEISIDTLLQELVDDEIIDLPRKQKMLNDLFCNYNSTSDCKVDFIETYVVDKLKIPSGITINERASSLSVFDDELSGRNLQINYSNGQQARLPSMNRFNFEAGYPYLLSRAVAYGAGMINHFFRGRLEAGKLTLNDKGLLEFKIKNVSKNDNDIFSGGSLLAYYDSISGERKTIGGISINSENGLQVGETVTLQAIYPTDISDSSEKPFTVVYRGTIGEEEGIAAVVEDDIELTGLLVNASYTPTDGFPGYQRLVTQVDGVWKSIPFPAGKAGNVDWKGQYVNGQPTRVLTWDGERTRSFPVGSVPRSQYIYQGGRAFARMPCVVLGAAVRKDGGGEWLIGICATTTGVRAMERPNTRNLSTATYDPDSAPEGWRDLGSYDYMMNKSASWFFNSSGTEAQTVSRVPTSEPSPFHLKMERIKMALVNGKAKYTIEESEYPVETASYSCESNCTDLESGSACEGIVYEYETDTHLVRSETGRYPIAVDYRYTEGGVEQEVVGRVINNSVYQRDVTSNASTDGIESSASITASSATTGKRQLIFGSHSFDLLSNEGSFSNINATAERSSTGIYTFTSSLDEVSLYEQHNLVYLDLRSGLLMSEDLHYDNYFHGAKAVDGKYAETVEGQVFYRALVDNGMSQRYTGKIFDVVYGPKESDRTGPTAGNPVNSDSLCNVPDYVYYFQEYPEPTDSYIGAATAVDSDNRTALSLYITNNLNTYHLEQLDTGQLKALIPGAPDNPSYDIRLIK